MVGASLALAFMASSASELLAERQDRARLDSRRFYPDDPLWQDDDRRDIAPVKHVELSGTYDLVENTWGNPARTRGAALNVNTLGEVPDSSWFTNRLGLRDMTIDEVLRGAAGIDGPAPGPWTIIGRPGSGITPKFTIRDSKGEVFVVKLDPPEAPELHRGQSRSEQEREGLQRGDEVLRPGQRRELSRRFAKTP